LHETPADEVHLQHNFARDVTSAVLFMGAAGGLMSLFAFIASKRMGASVLWVGVIGAASYLGYLWNLFFSHLTARLSLRRGMLVMMAVGAALLGIGAFANTKWPYCVTVVAFVTILALWEVQYNTLVGSLYNATERPRLLSRRQFALSLTAAVLAAIFGQLSRGDDGHQWAFLIAGAMMLAATFVFRGIRTTRQTHMEPFHALDVARTVWRDRRFRRLAAILTLYGWVGAGVGTLLVLLYKAVGFQESHVGWLTAVRIVGTMVGLTAVTPRLRFAGGISNFRLCFTSSAAAMIIFLIAGLTDLGRWTFALLACGEFAFGISAAGFHLAMQTTGLSLAGPDQITLYVNAIMVVQGLRGLVAPILVAVVLRYAGLQPTLIASVAVALLCAALVMLPKIDGETRHAS